MRLLFFLLIVSLAFSKPLAQAQDIPYIESWKKGKRKIEEKAIEINLTREAANFKTAIKDSNGKTRYELSVTTSDKQDKKSEGIHHWNVTLLQAGLLFKLSDGNNVDLLKPANDPFQDSFSWEDQMGQFWPWCKNQHRDDNESCKTNEWFFKKRVIKVENFFVILQVKNYQFEPGIVPKLYPKLSSLTLQAEFTNSYTKQK